MEESACPSVVEEERGLMKEEGRLVRRLVEEEEGLAREVRRLKLLLIILISQAVTLPEL